MNIIISSLDECRLTFPNGDSSSPIDLDSIRLWVEKSLDQESTNIRLAGESNENSYTLTKILDTKLEKNNYYGYRLESERSIPEGIYMVFVGSMGATEVINFKG